MRIFEPLIKKQVICPRRFDHVSKGPNPQATIEKGCKVATKYCNIQTKGPGAQRARWYYVIFRNSYDHRNNVELYKTP